MKNIVCIAGKNSIAVNSLNYLLNDLNYDKNLIKVVINKTDTGIESWQPSMKKFAQENSIHIVELEDIYDIENLIFISLEFDKIIKPEKFKTNKLYNMHFSLLPAYKGMYTSIIPLLNGEIYGGVTFHYIDKGIDTGDIIKQKKYEVSLTDTARDVYFKNLKYSFDLFKEVVVDVLNDNIISNPQTNINASYYSKKYIDFKNINIDFNKTSYEIYNQLRAYIFPEYQLPTIKDKEIQKAVLTNDKMEFNSIIEDDEKFEISGIDGYKILAYKTKESND